MAWDGCTNPSVDSAPHRFTCQTCPCLTCQLARAAPLASSFTAVLSLTPKPTCHRGIEALQEDACATLPVPLGPQSVTCHSASLTSICPFLHRSSKRCPPSVLRPCLPPPESTKKALGLKEATASCPHQALVMLPQAGQDPQLHSMFQGRAHQSQSVRFQTRQRNLL